MIPIPNLQALVDERQKHWKELVDKHFPPEGTDFTLVVLKAHMLIEQYLNALIIRHCGHPEHIEDIRFQYKDKITLVKALMTFALADQVWEGVLLINTLRNALAHNLESPNLQNHKANLRRLANGIPYSIPNINANTEYGALYTVYAFCQLHLGLTETLMGPIVEQAREQLRATMTVAFAPKPKKA